MKRLKMLGLAMTIALGLMASTGGRTASATTLSTDAAGTAKYGVGMEVHWTLKSGTSMIIETTEETVIATCRESTVKGKIETATGTWVSESIESLIWGGPEEKNCSQTTDTVTNGRLEIMQTSGDAGTVVGKGSEVTLTLFGVSCVYGTGAGTTLGTISGGAEPELAINAVLPKISGSFLCPSSTRWKLRWVVAAPHALHIVS